MKASDLLFLPVLGVSLLTFWKIWCRGRARGAELYHAWLRSGRLE